MPERLPDEQLTELLAAPGLRIERIVSTGQASPPGFPGSHKIRGMDRVRNVIRKSEGLKPRKATIKETA